MRSGVNSTLAAKPSGLRLQPFGPLFYQGLSAANLFSILNDQIARLPVCPSARLPVCPSARLPVCPCCQIVAVLFF
jgi:hypothetical protein